MRWPSGKVSMGFVLLLVIVMAGALTAAPGFAQQAADDGKGSSAAKGATNATAPDSVKAADSATAASSVNVVQVVGLAGVKEHAKGALSVENGNLQFVHAKVNTVVATSAIQDVVTGNDSQRMIRGFVGTLTMFAPYESGRFLSLFRSKLDTLTVKYQDSDGGVHGAIFTMAVGKAEPLKKLLLAQGAHTTIPVQDPKTDVAAKEQKP